MKSFRFMMFGAAGLMLGSGLLPALAAVPTADQNFANQMAQDNMSQVQDAQLAEALNAPQAVKVLAQRISRDHVTALKDLKAIDQQEGLGLPTHVQAGQQEERTKLSNMQQPTDSQKNTSREHAYVADEVTRLKREVDQLTTESSHGADPALKAYAQKYLPVIQADLEAAQAVHLPS